MDAGAWLREAERDLPLVDGPGRLLGADGGVLVIAPHPDDESIGCGGLLATCAAAGHPAQVIVVSDGAASHPGSPVWRPALLAALRQQEARAAVTALGLDPARDLHFLGLPDGAVPSEGAAFEAALQAARQVARAPAAVVTAWRHDPHCDHAASFVLARALAQAVGTPLYEYPVWGLGHAHDIPGFPMPVPPQLAVAPRGIRLDIRGQLVAKRRAIAAHASQHGQVVVDAPINFALPEALLALALRPFELLLEATP